MRHHVGLLLTILLLGCVPEQQETEQQKTEQKEAEQKEAEQKERQVPLSACMDLHISGALALRLQEGDTPRLSISGSPIALDAVEVVADAGRVEVDATVLADAQASVVSVDLSCPDLASLQLIGDVTADIGEAPRGLKRIAVYGSSAVNGRGLSAPDTDLRASGQATIHLVDLDLGDVQLLVGGASEVVLAGSGATLQINAAGRAKLALDKLRVQTVVVDATGASAIDVWATAHLNALARDTARITYRGEPDLRVEADPTAEVIPAA